MKKRVFLILAAVIFLGMTLSGCSEEQAKPGKVAQEATVDMFSDENKIPYGERLEIEGAASVERQADVKNSPYYPQLDFYNMKSTDTLTILENFKTIQQATEWTCGPTSALMVLEYYGKRGDLNEMDLVALRQKDEPGATNLQQMINIFEGLGGWDIYSTYDMEDPDDMPMDMVLQFLKEGKPVLIGWDDWGGHWLVIIGYDTMGTETTADDVLIMADPYDTTDHNQDGYLIQPFERVYYNWGNTFDPDFSKNVFLVPTPSQ